MLHPAVPKVKVGQQLSNPRFPLGAFVKEHRSGTVVAQDTGFRIASDPDTVLAPDAAFLDPERSRLITRRGYAAVAPNIVVEVLSPDDRPADVLNECRRCAAA